MLGPEYRLSPANIQYILRSNFGFNTPYDKPRSHTGLEWRAGSETLGHVTRSRSRLNNRILKGVRIAKSIPVWLNLGETLYGVLRTEYYSISLRSTYIEHLDSNSISVLFAPCFTPNQPTKLSAETTAEQKAATAHPLKYS
ncbi:hypothetical protein PCH_Pc22g20910 [Penicillium rubens Wisconsin 54-1255]|uniref:Uncharacterized protein n=1 Tax=Penicillium rubens (strain ATCC 28089 / DSM 1075 / NRRL 1951 / Wisconsin 54-1255) TaxID=500485 RepID=B6HRM5_PENRW|nr:hypothetical protein PCH_Pc22g20910 [Penicillium rubens Wisconsin 54-1255]